MSPKCDHPCDEYLEAGECACTRTGEAPTPASATEDGRCRFCLGFRKLYQAWPRPLGWVRCRWCQGTGKAAAGLVNRKSEIANSK